ncbi:hypothetical protein EDD22DRAFT_847714 [Suillus occidentalis]|nr:hypothetical protein EDD22DRAFT_847714 [Suillus occidentalis]
MRIKLRRAAMMIRGISMAGRCLLWMEVWIRSLVVQLWIFHVMNCKVLPTPRSKEAHDGSEELDDAGIDLKAYSKDDNIDDLAEEMDDNTNDGGTMKLCRGSEIDILILLTLGLSKSREFSDLSDNRVWFRTYMGVPGWRLSG